MIIRSQNCCHLLKVQMDRLQIKNLLITRLTWILSKERHRSTHLRKVLQKKRVIIFLANQDWLCSNLLTELCRITKMMKSTFTREDLTFLEKKSWKCLERRLSQTPRRTKCLSPIYSSRGSTPNRMKSLKIWTKKVLRK